MDGICSLLVATMDQPPIIAFSIHFTMVYFAGKEIFRCFPCQGQNNIQQVLGSKTLLTSVGVESQIGHPTKTERLEQPLMAFGKYLLAVVTDLQNGDMYNIITPMLLFLLT